MQSVIRLAIVASATALTLSAGAFAGIAPPVHDIYLSALDGQLTTAGFSDETQTIADPAQRVFASVLGQDPEFPFSTDEPGIRGDLPGITVTLNLHPGLFAWTGAGFAASNATLLVEYAGDSAQSDTGGTVSFLAGPGLHVHPGYTLMGAGGADPRAGIYLAAYTASAPGLATSQTFWMVFNMGSSDADHAAAVDWANANLVPAPAALWLLAGAGLTSRRARSRTPRRTSRAAP